MNNGLLTALVALAALLLGVQVLVVINLVMLNVALSRLGAYCQTVISKLDGQVDLGGGLTWQPLKGLPALPVEAPANWVERIPLVGHLSRLGRSA